MANRTIAGRKTGSVAEALADGLAVAHELADAVDGERYLGDEDGVRSAGDARLERDPAGVAAHHLDEHDAMVRLGRRMDLVDGVGRGVQRGVEPECDLG